MAAIEIEGVTKRFGAMTAVDDLTLSIRDKEFVALLGPSGCGKSTTMNLISGIEQPTSGAIRFDGADMRQIEPGRRGVGFVFQNYAIFTHMTVRQNLAFGLKMTGIAARDVKPRVEQIAALVHLTDSLGLSAGALNVNEMQRLAIGRAAIMRPQIFLLDEPLSNLNAAFRARMRTELKLLQQELKQTMVYVTHDQLEAMSMADRIAVMNGGRLQQYGSPMEVYRDPANVFVAGFMGSPGMNLLHCRAVALGGRLSLDFAAGGRLDLPPSPLRDTCESAAKPDLILGIRPEHLKLRPAAASPGGLLCTVTFVERIGARTLVYLDCGGQEIVVTERHGRTLSIGAAMVAEVSVNSVCLFDKVTGLRLRAREVLRGAA
jgi:multiple sugar transport system ATP-binding protein